MQIDFRYIRISLVLILITVIHTTCEKKIQPVESTEETETTQKATGLMQEEEMISMSSIPKDLSIITIQDAGDINMGSAVSLVDYMPPVKSQGPYGTCTAWGSGYYARTIMYARENNLTKADLEDPANQFSPKYLFLAIPDEHKGQDCGGSWPGAAFEVMQTRGIATEEEVPYENLNICAESIQQSWDENAADYKIENYRAIGENEFTVETFKSYLAMGRPVQISCKLDENFYGINNSEVYTSADADYNNNPGYHSMCLIGYDDNKGTSGAFQIVNSWGRNWGDEGIFWIDYNFFIETFCYAAYVIEGDKGGLSEDLIDQNVVNPNFRVDGKDLISIRFTDEVDPQGSSPKERLLTYNVFNKGSETITADNDWDIVYYYYNAYDPSNDYGVIVYDYYTDDVGESYEGQNGDFADVNVPMDSYGLYNWWNYVDVPAGYSVAKAVYDDGYDYDFEFLYTMPDLTGEYYFVLMADGFNNIDEQYEQNNFIFLTAEDKEPLYLENGIIQNKSNLKKMEDTPMHFGAMKKKQPNSYRLDELSELIKYQKRRGMLEKKAIEFMKKRKEKNYRGPIKRVVPAKLPREM